MMILRLILRLVIDEMKSILSFWLDLGIDGVRMDAISHLIEDDLLLDEPRSFDPEAVDELDWKYLDHIYTNNQNLTRSIITELSEHVKTNYGEDKFVVLETDLGIPEVMDYYQCGDIPFNFNLARNLGSDITAEKVLEQVDAWLESLPGDGVADWVTGSHDIGRVASRVSDQGSFQKF